MGCCCGVQKEENELNIETKRPSKYVGCKISNGCNISTFDKMAESEGEKQYDTYQIASTAKLCCVDSNDVKEAFHEAILMELFNNRKLVFEWTTNGLNIVDYDDRMILDAKPLGGFTIKQVLQVATMNSMAPFNKETNGCRNWVQGIMDSLRQYNNGSKLESALVGLLLLHALNNAEKEKQKVDRSRVKDKRSNGKK